MQQRTIPTYALYGEFLSGTRADLVHHETIHERSSKHGWHIKPHRHERLMQVFLFRTPNVFGRIGGIPFGNTGPAVLFVPAMIVHGFRFPPNIVGDVLSFPINPEAQTIDASVVTAPLIVTSQTPEELERFIQVISHLRAAFQTLSADREALLCHLSEVLMIYYRAHARIGALGGAPVQDPDMSKDEAHAHAFCKLIERSFSTQAIVTDYAAQLGISAPHLNRIAKRILAETPNALITKRRMIEAERLLTFTRNSIALVALRSGYQDAPYFNRAFKKKHAMSPGEFRKRTLT